MAVSKVAYDGHTLIDLTQDTAVESDVASGKTFHKADGSIAVGTASGGGGTVNLQNKTVNLGSSAPSSVSADAGYDGLGQVSFNVSGISANKIKDGESICGVQGSYKGAAFNHSVGINIDVADGTYQLSLALNYRTMDSTDVKWATMEPEEHEEDGYYTYTADVGLCTGSGMDGFFLTESSGYDLDSGYMAGKTYIEVYHSGNTRTWYFFVPSDASTYNIVFTP